MKSKLIVVFSLLALTFSSICFAQQFQTKSKSTSLFTQQKKSSWIYVVNNKQLAPSDVFVLDNGTLKISGTSTGYIRTRKKYSNYVLNLEWRWTKKLGNSGVLIHIQQKDTIWPKCYQVQQKADAAGDIICMNGLWAKECTDSVKFTIKKTYTSNEKPLGEWNSMQIICKKKNLKVYVNEVLQNSITELTVQKGYIGFQNEGTAIEFRGLKITSAK